ncbi:hypothetical protein C8J56DRAFT_892593 [Mycena floridula]|nr:hypothetical protein C8J56DRAFT_892593 [Mycena floridula]
MKPLIMWLFFMLNRNKLNERLLAFVKEQDEKLEQIAKEEDTDINHCRTLLSTSLKQRCKMNAHNTFMSLKAFELNADRAPGNKLKLKEIQAAVEADKTVENATEEEIEKVKELLEEKHVAHMKGARGSHRGEAKDIAAFSRKMGDDFFNIHQRTGAIGFGFLTRPDIDCSDQPCWWATGNAAEFVQQQLNSRMWDLLRMFESWGIATANGPAKGPSNMNEQKKTCALIILSNLIYISRSKDIHMNYINYKREIVVPHKVHLIGWPAHVPFGAPSTLTCSCDVRDLLDALQCGSCCWAKVMKRELDAVKQKVAAKEPKRWAKRSDAGGTHAKSSKATKGKKKRAITDVEAGDGDDDTDSVNNHQSKCRRVTKGDAPAFTSPETIATDDEDDT